VRGTEVLKQAGLWHQKQNGGHFLQE
jgi:hypothetical protein